ncbi:hypothetical protein BD311DRAFT_232293 [Dichomitus squalens]|uniref:Uncharacterized protein n=1 Tax=Dichomitus squalens TaxID=114155 RepID=A0A4Q9MV99_9APHY|nr:hypothetical protein BD311DRAFT_232293 [Dichomitus squalens]
MDPLHRRSIEEPSTHLVLSLIAIGAWCVLLLDGHGAQGAYTYFRRYPKDGYVMKTLIGALCIVNGLHTFAVLYSNYATLVQNRSSADVGAELLQSWECWMVADTACLTLLVSHLFFARRVYKLGYRPWHFVLFVGTMLALGLAFTVVCTAFA